MRQGGFYKASHILNSETLTHACNCLGPCMQSSQAPVTACEPFVYHVSSFQPCTSIGPRLHLRQQPLLIMQVLNAGLAATLGTDNTTGCLPDIWKFCPSTGGDPNLHLTCPIVSFRRPQIDIISGTTRVGMHLLVHHRAPLQAFDCMNITTDHKQQPGSNTCSTAVASHYAFYHHRSACMSCAQDVVRSKIHTPLQI